MCSVSVFPEHVDSVLTPKEITNLNLGFNRKWEIIRKQLLGKLVPKITLPITTICCVMLGKISKRKKSLQIVNECNNSKNNDALTLVIRKITKHNKMDYHQRNLILEKYADYKERLLLIYRNCIIM